MSGEKAGRFWRGGSAEGSIVFFFVSDEIPINERAIIKHFSSSSSNNLLSQVYKAFEEQVLNGTSEYYSKDGETAMQKFSESFVEYMKYVQTRLNDELKRAKLLHPTSQTPLMQLCCRILIEKHMDAFDTEFRVWTFNRLF